MEPGFGVREPILKTGRLTLSEMSEADLAFMVEMLGDAEVMRYYPAALGRDGARDWIARQRARYEREGHGLWLVTERETGRPLGQVGLVLQQLAWGAEREIGYMIHRPFWRKGFALEAASAVREFAFKTLGLEQVISLIRPENTPSIAVAEALGMRPWRDAAHGGFDHQVYRLAADQRPSSHPAQP